MGPTVRHTIIASIVCQRMEVQELCYPIPIDLGYHSKVPMHDGQEPISKSCEFTGGACYYDGSSLNAAEAMYSLVNGGDKALWEFLEAYYEHVFYGGAFPDPKEYPAKLRD